MTEAKVLVESEKVEKFSITILDLSLEELRELEAYFKSLRPRKQFLRGAVGTLTSTIKSITSTRK